MCNLQTLITWCGLC